MYIIIDIMATEPGASYSATLNFLFKTSDEWEAGVVNRPLYKGEVAWEIEPDGTIWLLKGDGYPPNAGPAGTDYTRLRVASSSIKLTYKDAAGNVHEGAQLRDIIKEIIDSIGNLEKLEEIIPDPEDRKNVVAAISALVGKAYELIGDWEAVPDSVRDIDLAKTLKNIVLCIGDVDTALSRRVGDIEEDIGDVETPGTIKGEIKCLWEKADELEAEINSQTPTSLNGRISAIEDDVGEWERVESIAETIAEIEDNKADKSDVEQTLEGYAPLVAPHFTEREVTPPKTENDVPTAPAAKDNDYRFKEQIATVEDLEDQFNALSNMTTDFLIRFGYTAPSSDEEEDEDEDEDDPEPRLGALALLICCGRSFAPAGDVQYAVEMLELGNAWQEPPVTQGQWRELYDTVMSTTGDVVAVLGEYKQVREEIYMGRDNEYQPEAMEYGKSCCDDPFSTAEWEDFV